jgi:hypothetical protein
LGRDINRRLLEMERHSCRPAPAASLFGALIVPTGEPGWRAPGLRFALFGALSQFRYVLGGFYARDLRPLVEQHLANPHSMRQMAYDLRRFIRRTSWNDCPAAIAISSQRSGGSSSSLWPTLQPCLCCGLLRLDPDHPVGDLNQAGPASTLSSLR